MLSISNFISDKVSTKEFETKELVIDCMSNYTVAAFVEKVMEKHERVATSQDLNTDLGAALIENMEKAIIETLEHFEISLTVKE